MIQQIISVVGATATGKSEFALLIGQALGGPDRVEMINADAMQLYCGMDIGTAKLSLAERKGFVHRQLDEILVTQEASVAVYQRKARLDLEQIWQMNKIPIVVGGSGIYLRALLENIEFPPTDVQLRAEIMAQANENPSAIYEKLMIIDPAAAQVIVPNNIRRVVRALEVIELTGKPFSAQQPQPKFLWPTLQFQLTMPVEKIRERVAIRGKNMFAQGLLAETEKLLSIGIRQGKTACGAIGYAQAIAVLEQKMSLAQAQESLYNATMKIVKKQRTWFRRDQRSHILEHTGNLDEILDIALPLVNKIMV